MKYTVAILAVIIVLLGYNSVYEVKEGQADIVTQFGHILRTDTDPGVHFKVPLLQQTQRVDNRLLSFDVSPEQYVTADKQNITVEFYVKWRIADATVYNHATSGDELQADQRLTPVVKNALRTAVNAFTLAQLISGGQGDILGNVVKQADSTARTTLGMQVVDVRVTKVLFPDDITASVYKRMDAERQAVANSLRAEGKQQAETIKAAGDRKAQMMRADAESAAQKVRGEGDAQAAQIYAEAYSQDPDFFAFYRSLEAYKKAFADGKSVFILKPDSDFLHYFGSPTPAAKH
jgi:membrane protease subunit HflC